MLTIILDNAHYDLDQYRKLIAVDNEELTGSIQDDVDLSALKEQFADRPQVHPGGA